MVEYAYSFLRLTLPNLNFITAHSSLITAQMGSVSYPPILDPVGACIVLCQNQLVSVQYSSYVARPNKYLGTVLTCTNMVIL